MNLSHCVKSYGHLCQIYQTHSPNMVMSRDPGFKFRNFSFSANSVLNFKKFTKFEENWLKNKKLQAKKQIGRWKTPPPPSAYRVKDKNVRDLVNKFPLAFTGVGKLKDHAVKLNIDDKVIPIARPQRRIPFHVRDKVEDAIEKLEKEGIIERVPESQPTPCVSLVVVVPKSDKTLRLWVDMRMVNQTIQRVCHLIPTVEDISLDLNQAKYFTKPDLSQAHYHQLPLDEKSRFITTFSTHLGLFRYTRLPYGINAAAEILQYTLQQQLHGIDWVRNIADDIIVFGTTKQQHNTVLGQCLKRLSDKGLTLNSRKCSFLQLTLSFFGQIFSAERTRPDPKRVQNASEPQNASEVRSLLEMASYNRKYIKYFATITAPLES